MLNLAISKLVSWVIPSQPAFYSIMGNSFSTSLLYFIFQNGPQVCVLLMLVYIPFNTIDLLYI